jgi:hypothetical protein
MGSVTAASFQRFARTGGQAENYNLKAKFKSKNHPAGLDEPGWTMSLPKDVLPVLKQGR